MSTGPRGGPVTATDWDAGTYDRISDPQFGWAVEQLERTELSGQEAVLDAGCGSGRVTELLARRTTGPVYAVDQAPSMVAHVRARLGERVTALCQDLSELELPAPVDLIFSNATFHWIADHERLFARLGAALRPGGRLVAQCGGKGNIDTFRSLAESVAGRRPYAEYFAGWRRPWNYAEAQETARRLQDAGFGQVRTWLEPRSVTLEAPRAFVQTVCLVRHLDPLPEDLRGRFVDEVLSAAGRPLVLEYVRLNLTASRLS